MTGIMKAIKDTPEDDLNINNVKAGGNKIVVSSNNRVNTFNNNNENLSNPSILVKSKSDNSLNKRKTNGIDNKGNSKKKNKMLSNGKVNKSGKKDSSEDEIQEFVEDFLMDAYLTSKEIDMEHHKDLFTAPAFDSENNFDQFSMSSFIKQQQNSLYGKNTGNRNVDMLGNLNTLKKSSATIDPILELDKMKNSEGLIKSYSNPDLLSINNNGNSNNYQTLNSNHISSSPSEFVLNKNNNDTNNSYLKTASSPLNSAGSPNPNSNQYLSPLGPNINNKVPSPGEDEKVFILLYILMNSNINLILVID